MLGNYLGALKQWVPMLDTHDCIFSIVNLHAITLAQEPKDLRRRTLEVAATYLACGIDPKKATIFVQSHVPEHAELAWVLGCHTWMGELERMTQFKDKSNKQKSVGAGLFFYPVLMASDILLHDTNLVPVGHDQKQHIELARDIAIRMNNYKEKIFVVPEPMIPPVGARIMSLQDPTAKMSKSDPIPNATVFLNDSDDDIVKKFKKAVTDSGSEITYDDEKSGVKNLISIQAAITGKKPQEIVDGYTGKQYGHLKIGTAEIVVECLKPIRQKFNELMNDETELQKILDQGAEKARARAAKALKRTFEALGLSF